MSLFAAATSGRTDWSATRPNVALAAGCQYSIKRVTEGVMPELRTGEILTTDPV